MIKKLAVLFLLFAAGIVSAQPSLEWTATFGGPYPEFGQGGLETSDGGLLVAGTALVLTGGGHTDYMLVKTDIDGNEVWTRSFGGALDQEAVWIVLMANGDMMLLGDEEDPDDGEDFTALTRLDSDGQVIWTSQLVQGFDADFLVRSVDGGVLILGSTEEGDEEDLWMLKADGSGNIEWSITVGGTGNDNANGAVALPDGGFAICGYTESLGTVPGATYGVLVRLSADGDPIWTRTFGDGNDHQFQGIARTSDSGFVMVGGEPTGDYYMVKTNSEGIAQWETTFGDPTLVDYGVFVTQNDDGSYIVGGWSGMDMDDTDTMDMQLVKTDAVGDMDWSVNIGEAGQTDLGVPFIVSDGSIGFAGMTGNFASFQIDLWLAKTTPGVVGVNDGGLQAQLPDSPLLLDAYPNPFNAMTRISLALAQPGQVRVTVTDILGREVATIADGIMTAGNQHFSFNASELGSGTYFIHAVSEGGQTVSRKLTLLR